MEAISWPILTDTCDRLPYSLHYICQTVKVLALEAFLHIQEQCKATRTHKRTGERMLQSFLCQKGVSQVAPQGSMHIHAAQVVEHLQCQVNTAATMLYNADSPQTFGSTLHSEFSPLKTYGEE
jgi:hypothetical protein